MNKEAYKKRLDAVAKRTDQDTLPEMTLVFVGAKNGKPTGERREIPLKEWLGDRKSDQ